MFGRLAVALREQRLEALSSGLFEKLPQSVPHQLATALPPLFRSRVDFAQKLGWKSDHDAIHRCTPLQYRLGGKGSIYPVNLFVNTLIRFTAAGLPWPGCEDGLAPGAKYRQQSGTRLVLPIGVESMRSDMRGVLMSLSIAALAVGAGAEAQGMTLTRDGQPRATIVVAADAGEKVKLAAEELQTYLQKISGAKLPITTDTEQPSGVLILVGKSRLTEALPVAIPAGLTNARREEGFVIYCRGDRLLLAGNDAGPYHGTEYAVYTFLQRLGVRWFMPGDFGEYVPRQATISVPELRVTERPDFLMRNWWLHAKPELAELERRWKIRNRMNPDAMFAIPGDSSARNILPEAQYFKEHPEWFAMNPDGTRNPYLPNLSHPQAVAVAASIIKEHFRKNPDANSYGFAPDDGLPRDYSRETLQWHQGFFDLGGRPGVPAEASITEEWMRFVNAVTAEVRKEFPDAYIATNGYANRNLPPQGVKLDENLVIMFAAIWSCTLHAYDDPHCWQKVRQGQILQQWTSLCKNVWIYGYHYQMLVSALTPLPETRKLRRDFPLLKKWGVIGFWDEARNQWAENGIASRYLRAYLEWNANADADAILEDFYAHWYGKAAAPMRAYYDALEDAIEKTSMHGHEDRILPEVYTPELLATLQKHVAAAERAADSERARLHVRADRLITDHLAAYMAMAAADAAGDWAGAAQAASRMLEIRKDLHAINPFFIWSDEDGYHTGVWYWKVGDRRDFYQSLADRTSGKTGDLVALFSERARFRTDPHDDGIHAGWYRPGQSDADWKSILTTRSFYSQGYQDEQGHTYCGTLWYRFRERVPASARGRKVILYCPTVETEAWVWVNGQYIGHRPYLEAYIRPAPMEMDVTDALRPGETNEITIRVSTSLSPAQAGAGLLSRVFLYSPKE